VPNPLIDVLMDWVQVGGAIGGAAGLLMVIAYQRQETKYLKKQNAALQEIIASDKVHIATLNRIIRSMGTNFLKSWKTLEAFVRGRPS
jgi:hypothetical protein